MTPELHDDVGFRRYVNKVDRYPVLDRKAELKLARRWRDKKDQKAGDLLVQANLRYVIQIALKYRGYGIKLADLIEEGNLGLLEALRRFEPERKLRYMTYAAFWVRAFILAYVLKQWSLVGVGSSPVASKMFFRLNAARARLVQEAAGEATSDEIDEKLADEFGTSPDRIRTMSQRLGAHDASLDAQAFRDEGLTFVDMLVDEAPDQEELTAAGERDAWVRGRVAEIWGELDDRERLIVEERLLSGDNEATLADLGRRLGLSRERVRQLEERVKGKLRTALKAVA